MTSGRRSRTAGADEASPHGPWRVLGGPLGAHTSRRSASLRAVARLAVLLTAVPVLAALALRGWCLRNGFGGQSPMWRACYSDLPTLLGDLKDGVVTADPVVTAAALRAVATLAPDTDAAGQAAFVILWAFVSLLLLAVCAVALTAYLSAADRAEDGRAGQRVAGRVLLFVLLPAVPLGLLIAGDIVGVTLMVLGLLAWRLRHDVPAGLLLTVAAFSRGVAGIVLLVVVTVALVRGRAIGRLLVGAGGGLLAVLALGLLTGAASLTEPLARWWGAVPGYGSLWVLPSVAASSSSSAASLESLRTVVSAAVLGPTAMTVITVVGWIAAVGLVWWLARARFRPSTADLALVGVAVVLLVSPALPVQASLWLAPLAVLSSLPRRDVLIWAVAEVLYFPAVWLYLAGLETPDRGLPGGWYAMFLLLRVGAIAYLVWRVSEDARFGVVDDLDDLDDPQRSVPRVSGFAPERPERVPL